MNFGKLIHRSAKFGTVLFAAFVLLSCAKKDNEPTTPDSQYIPISVHVSLGLPKDSDSSDDYIINRRQYVLSYNKNLNVANWVAWELNASWFGDAERGDKFYPDTSLPEGFYRVVTGDYTNSGYDRGHTVRSEERTIDDEDNRSTFLMTNIMPQTPDLNRGVWLNFEYFCQSLAQDSLKELFIYSGGVYHSGARINDLVAIPDSCFKIVVVLDSGKALKDVNASTTIYAVMMPNIAGIRSVKWPVYATTVDEIERSTGYDFLNEVPKQIQAIIESKKNTINLKKAI